MAALYFCGPNIVPRQRLMNGKNFVIKNVNDRANTLLKEFDSYDFLIFCDFDAQKGIVDQPEKVQKAFYRLLKMRYDYPDSIRAEAIINLPGGVTNLEEALADWMRNEVKNFVKKYEDHATSIRTDKKVLYHSGPPGRKVGDVIEPYFKTRNEQLGDYKLQILEQQFEQARKLYGGKIPRLGSAYAFEDPEDAIHYGVGSKRVIYSVVPLGQTERHDMRCVDQYEQASAEVAEVAEGYKSGEEDELEEDEYFIRMNKNIDDNLRAYWQGKPAVYDSILTPHEPIWEIVCADGFKIVAVDDRVNETVVMSVGELKRLVNEDMSGKGYVNDDVYVGPLMGSPQMGWTWRISKNWSQLDAESSWFKLRSVLAHYGSDAAHEPWRSERAYGGENTYGNVGHRPGRTFIDVDSMEDDRTTSVLKRLAMIDDLEAAGLVVYDLANKPKYSLTRTAYRD